MPDQNVLNNLESIQREAGLPDFVKPAEYINRVLPYIFGLAGIILIFMFITSGYKMMTSAGDPKVMEAAKAKITTSVVGITVLLVAFWLIQIILKFVGIGGFTGDNIIN